MPEVQIEAVGDAVHFRRECARPSCTTRMVATVSADRFADWTGMPATAVRALLGRVTGTEKGKRAASVPHGELCRDCLAELIRQADGPDARAAWWRDRRQSSWSTLLEEES